MAHPVAEAFRAAAGLVRSDPNRRGNCLVFGAGEEIVYAGDIHGHRANLAKIIAFADLPTRTNRRLVLQEIIHCEAGSTASSPPSGDAGLCDRSFEVLLRAVRLKLSLPQRVFFLLGNHDLAEVTGQEIAKAGRGACKAFNAGLDAAFGAEADQVRSAVRDFFLALPLAARCANGVLLTHSLPAPGRMHLVDWTVLDRPYRPEDWLRGGSVYEWTWGRGHTPEQLDDIAHRLGARAFLLGHQPVEEGRQLLHDRGLIVASDHAGGAVVVFDAGQPIAPGDLVRLVRAISKL